MATLKAPKNISRRQELRKDAVTTVWVRIQDLFFSNRNLVYGIVVGIVVLIAGILGYSYLQGVRAAEAEDVLGGIIRTYEGEEYDTALNGTETAVGLIEIIEEYGSTPSGNMARFYAADASFRIGEYDQALEFFLDFDGSDDVLGASALAGAADVHEIKGEYERAGNLFLRAARSADNELVSPAYLMKSGRAYEKAGEFDNAADAYQTIRDEYENSSEANDIDFYLSRAQAMSN